MSVIAYSFREVYLLSLAAPCRFDFESGIDDWETTGTVFNNQPTFRDNHTARPRRQRANQQRDWWIGEMGNRSNSMETPAGEV